MREIFRLCFRNYDLPAEIVMIAHGKAETADFERLKQTLNHTLNQIEKWLR
jgi:RNase P protein component